ncbi:hypothetical protein, partial [Couchioplanes caeruleus]
AKKAAATPAVKSTSAARRAATPASEAVPDAADDPNGLSAPAQRVLTANPALAAALATTADGPAIIDDTLTLVALMCVPDLLERVTAEPALLGRLRRENAVLDVAKEPPKGVPLPVRVFLGDSEAWTGAFRGAATRRKWNEDHGSGAGWTHRMLRTWCTATPEERRQIFDTPNWHRWVTTESHYPDGYHGADPWEPDKVCLSPDTVRPTAAAPPHHDWPRPEHPTAQQKHYVHDLAELYAGSRPGVGLAAVTAPAPEPSGQVMQFLGDLPAVRRRPVEVMGVGLSGYPSELLFYPARGHRPPAVVIPFRGLMLSTITETPTWNGFPIILTADVVTGVAIKVNWANAHRRVVISTSARPGATCPPPGAEVHLRGGQLPELAGRIRTHLGRR